LRVAIEDVSRWLPELIVDELAAAGRASPGKDSSPMALAVAIFA
jgi:hypothetical protein